jgi:hypothetical protein
VLQTQLEAALEQLEANAPTSLTEQGRIAADAYAAACAAESTEDGALLLAGFRGSPTYMDTEAAAEASLAVKGLECTPPS